MNTGGGGGGGGGGGEEEEEEEEKTPSVESMCKSCLILQLTDKKLAKEDEHRRRRALHFAKSTHNFVCSPTQTDKKLVKEDGHRRKKKKKKKKRLHLWNPCTIHVCSPENSRKLQKKKEDRRRSFASYTKA
jgi:hypothetical protein